MDKKSFERKYSMGLSSNARLLTITARLTSNEYESQQISNAKMRLATQAQQASDDYIVALNTPQYSFVSYDSTGNSIQTALTPAVLCQYGDSKNQYLLTNSAGKALVSSEDAKNFEKSATLQDFLKCYDLDAEYKTDNLKKYYEALKGDMDVDGSCKSWNEALAAIKSQNLDAEDPLSQAIWSNDKHKPYIDAENEEEILDGPQGLYESALLSYNYLISLVNDGEEVASSDLDIARANLNSIRQIAVDHVSYDSWLESKVRDALEGTEDENQAMNNSAKAMGTSFKNISNFITSNQLTSTEKTPDNVERYFYTSLLELGKFIPNVTEDADGNTTITFPTVENKTETYGKLSFSARYGSSPNELFSLLITKDTFNAFGLEDYLIKISKNNDKVGTISYKENGDIEERTGLIEQVHNLMDSITKYYTAKEAVRKYDIAQNTSDKFGLTTEKLKDAYDKLNAFRDNLSKYKAELETLGIDAKDAYFYKDATKAQWYTNLWYKMNGASTFKNPDAQAKYSVLDSKLMSSSTWITNAIKQGVINIEVANATNSGKTMTDANNPLLLNLNGITWTSKIFSSCSDIVQSDNDQAIAKAEAEYKRKTAEITAKDEKYQRKISLLDSEHNALQQEYESVKTAMSKNIERSFKAFQG